MSSAVEPTISKSAVLFGGSFSDKQFKCLLDGAFCDKVITSAFLLIILLLLQLLWILSQKRFTELPPCGKLIEKFSLEAEL